MVEKNPMGEGGWGVMKKVSLPDVIIEKPRIHLTWKSLVPKQFV